MPCQMIANGYLVERINTQTEVIEVPCFGTRCCPTTLSDRPINGDKINHRTAYPNMHEAQIIPASNDLASKNVTIEVNRALHRTHTQDEMINSKDGERHHGRSVGGRWLCGT